MKKKAEIKQEERDENVSNDGPDLAVLLLLCAGIFAQNNNRSTALVEWVRI